jgi:hypothetical protein
MLSLFLVILFLPLSCCTTFPCSLLCMRKTSRTKPSATKTKTELICILKLFEARKKCAGWLIKLKSKRRRIHHCECELRFRVNKAKHLPFLCFLVWKIACGEKEFLHCCTKMNKTKSFTIFAL